MTRAASSGPSRPSRLRVSGGWAPNPHANGGRLLRPLRLPDFRAYAVPVDRPAVTVGEATRVVGGFLRDVLATNADQRNFRVVGPDETASNRLGDLFDVTGRAWLAETVDVDESLHLRPDLRSAVGLIV